MHGVIVHINPRGFGFIGRPNADDLFFCARDSAWEHSGWNFSLKGRRVTYKELLHPVTNRWRAVDVQPVEET